MSAGLGGDRAADASCLRIFDASFVAVLTESTAAERICASRMPHDHPELALTSVVRVMQGRFLPLPASGLAALAILFVHIDRRAAVQLSETSMRHDLAHVLPCPETLCGPYRLKRSARFQP